MKYTLKEAREILGVTKNSSKHDIEMKYNIAMKKYKLLKSEGKLDEKSEADYLRSTDAYRIIMGYEVDEPKVEKKETYTDKAFKKAGIDRKKANNFFYYYKFHILISIIVVIAIVLTARSIIYRVDPDITIGLIGEVYTDGYDKLETKIKEKVPEIKEIAFDSAIVTNNFTSEQSYANMSKAMILLTASDTKLFLMNKYAYNNYAKDGAFMALEDVAKELDIDVSKSDYLKLRVIDEYEEPTTVEEERKVLKYRDAEPKLYGIDVTNSEFFKGIDIIGPEKILVIKVNTERNDLILKLVKLFAK